jgi:cyclic pyranopterin phosphate synthase
MPEEGVELSRRDELLSFEEIARVVGALQAVGVKRVRLTGGEPTVRKDLVELVRMLGELHLDDLAMTTNGQLLAELAVPLRHAGLTRLNVSVDTLDPMRFREITRRGDLVAVLDGIEAARAAGFRDTKLNAVVLRGLNDDELAALCRWAWEHELTPRFIESMPMSDGALFDSRQFVSAAEMRTRLSDAFGTLEAANPALPGVGPARYLRVATGPFRGRTLGIISAVSEPFCDTCNRVRLSAIGRLHTCLAHDDDLDLRARVRGGASDDELVSTVREALAQKRDSHAFLRCGSGGPRKHMVAIGG